MNITPHPSLLTPHALFLSDLHLCPERPHTTRIFENFLRGTASQADALYILGDLFEYWAGDDELADPHHAAVVSALAQLRQSGTAVFFMPGNRDFLIGEAFARAAGTQLLPDPSLIDLYGTPTLLMHGDTLCSGDSAYLAFRAQVREPAWQAAFLALPLAERKARIEQLRRNSEHDKQHKSVEEMDVDPDTVAAILRQHGYPRLIHGHTHRPARHLQRVDGRDCERWVLDSWYDHGSALRCDAAGCSAVQI